MTEKLIAKLRVNFPGEFKSHYPTDELIEAVSQSYSEEMIGYKPAQVDAAIELAGKREYLPKPSEFANCLRDTYGFPTTEEALQTLRNWRVGSNWLAKKGCTEKSLRDLEPVIYTTYMSMDVYLWVRMSDKQSKEHFEERYLAVIDGIAKGRPLKEPQIAIAKESVVKQEFKPGEVDSIRANLLASVKGAN